MLNGIKTLNEWLGTAIELLKSLVVVGIIVGILFDDFFDIRPNHFHHHLLATVQGGSVHLRN